MLIPDLGNFVYSFLTPSVSLAIGLSIFVNNQFLVLLLFSVCLFSLSLISVLISIISFYSLWVWFVLFLAC